MYDESQLTRISVYKILAFLKKTDNSKMPAFTYMDRVTKSFILIKVCVSLVFLLLELIRDSVNAIYRHIKQTSSHLGSLQV